MTRGGGAAALECEGVRRSFGDAVALDGADLAVGEGALVALLGPSGCGKSTLLRVVAGFERPDAGTVRVHGTVVVGPGVSVPPERRRTGIVPQEQTLFPHLDVAANVGYGLARGARRSARVGELLDLCGLAGLGRRMPHELSGGQQQRVALARALAPEPALVLLDEPFASLDAALRAELRTDVAAILRAAGQTAVLVTHDQDEALSLADTVAVMRAGRVVQHGRPEVVYASPADAWVARFVGRANVLDGRLTAPGQVRCALGVLAVVAGAAGGAPAGPVEVVVRPEQVVVGGPDAAPGAVVRDHEYHGHDALVRLGLPDGTTVVARVAGGQLPPVGAVVAVACRGPVPVYLRNGG